MKDVQKIKEFFSKPLNETNDWEEITIEDIKNEFGLMDGGRVDDGYSKTNSAIVPDVNTAVEILKYLDEKIYPYGIGGEPEEITKVWNKFPSSTVKLALPMFINSRFRQFVSFVFDDGSQYPPVFVYNSNYTESPAIWQRIGNTSWHTYGRKDWDEFFSKPLKEAKKETAVDMAKKKLDALGVKYEMSTTDKVKPFKVIYKPINKSDEFYDKFDDIVDLFNLKGVVKSSMSEAKEEGSYEVIWTDRDYKKHSKVFKNDPKGAPDNAKKKAEAFKKALEDKDKKSKDGLYRSIDLNEAKKEDAVDTITMDIPLFLRMLEYSREDASQDMDLHDVTEKANSLGKEKGILSMEDYDAIVGAAEDIKEAVNLKASKLSTAEYQKAKKLKDFKASDWKYDSKEDLYTKVNEAELSERISFDKALDLKLEKADLKKEIEQVRTDMEEEADESKANYYGRQLNKLEDRLAKVQKQIDNYDMNESTDYMKRKQKDLAEAILAKLKK